MRPYTSIGPYATFHHQDDDDDENTNAAYSRNRCRTVNPSFPQPLYSDNEPSFIPLGSVKRPKTPTTGHRRPAATTDHRRPAATRVVRSSPEKPAVDECQTYYDQYVNMLMERAEAKNRSIYGRMPDPGPRYGRAGGQWRHMRRVTECGGSNLMFVEGTVKQEDTLVNPPWNWDSFNRNPYHSETRMAYFVAPPVPEPPRPNASTYPISYRCVPKPRYRIRKHNAPTLLAPNVGVLSTGWKY